MRDLRCRAGQLGLSLILTTIVFAAPALAESAARLGGYNADSKESSVSGISSGAFMAVQFGIAWSAIIKGVGVIAGGPYDCARGTAIGGFFGNVQPIQTATGPCVKGPPPPLGPLFAQTDAWAHEGAIDDPRNIGNQRIYIFAGHNDSIVSPSVGEAAFRFYLHYLGDRDPGNVFFQNAIGAGHSQVTSDYGQPCNANAGYYIDDCNYDQAGIILQHIYGALNRKQGGPLSGALIPFDQREFTFPASPASYSMADTGYVYVPADCAAKQPCRVHIALHGCEQNFATIGDRYVRHAGYNEWADINRLIILYPQTIAGNPAEFEPYNPYGCWDWWGYTNFNYAVKAGRQITTIKAMLDRLTGRYVPNPMAPPSARVMIVNDVSDNGAALAWSPIAGANDYVVSRADGGADGFKEIGRVSQPSFGDMGLHAATSYSYRVIANPNPNPGPATFAVTAVTLPMPSRCSHPGSCPLH